MAQEEGNLSHGALFPPPPPFFKHFTTENVNKLKEIQQGAGIDDAKKDASAEERAEALLKLQQLDLPAELRFLVPPEPPAGRFRGFGEDRSLNETTSTIEEEPGYERLYPDTPPRSPAAGSQNDTEWTLDRAYYLKKMIRALLLNFMELMAILAQNPQKWVGKVQDLHLLIVNSHKLINDYRPHQARETMIMMVEEQLEKKKAEVESIKQMEDRIREMREALDKDGSTIVAEEESVENADRKHDLLRIQQEKDLCQLLEQELSV